jgi:hypothetical protein
MSWKNICNTLFFADSNAAENPISSGILKLECIGQITT